MTPKRRAALAAAAREAEALRKDWKDALQHHSLRIEAQFRELQRRMRSTWKGRPPKGLQGVPSVKDAEHLRTLLAGVRVKAGKGRAKDLRRIEKALALALERLPSE
jgi:hypothetical protein